MKKIFIAPTAIGCINHSLENSLFKNYFQANGWIMVNNPRNANLILINSCGLTQDSEDMSVDTILRMKKLAAEWQKIVVYGCLIRMNWKRFKSVFNGEYFDVLEKNKIDEIIGAKVKLDAIHCNVVDSQFNQFILQGKNGGYALRRKLSLGLYAIENLFRKHSLPVLSPFTSLCSYLRHTNIYTIIISSGCRNNCSYCIIRKARGKLLSKPSEQVLSEFREGLKQGFKNFELIGDDIGSYGKDINENLISLLRKIIKEEGDYKINLYHLYPERFNTMFKQLKEILKSGKFSSISVTLQSGNSRILKLMNRPYDLALLKRNFRELRNEVPLLRINTHLMVGFPSETEEEFMGTMRLLDETDFSQVAVFKYSDRPYAQSYEMDNKIPKKTIQERLNKMKMRIFFTEIKKITRKVFQ